MGYLGYVCGPVCAWHLRAGRVLHVERCGEHEAVIKREYSGVPGKVRPARPGEARREQVASRVHERRAVLPPVRREDRWFCYHCLVREDGDMVGIAEQSSGIEFLDSFQ